MDYITETEKVRVVIDPEFGHNKDILIQVHNKQLEKIAPLTIPCSILLPMDVTIIDSLIETLEEIKKVKFF